MKILVIALTTGSATATTAAMSAWNIVRMSHARYSLTPCSAPTSPRLSLAM